MLARTVVSIQLFVPLPRLPIRVLNTSAFYDRSCDNQEVESMASLFDVGYLFPIKDLKMSFLFTQ